MDVLVEENDRRRRLFLPCRLLRRFLLRRCPCSDASVSSPLDSEVSSSDEVEDELEDVLDDELDDEELGLDGDPEVRLGPLNRATLLNALPR